MQRIVNDLAKADLVALAPNPHHRRAPLVVLTEKGTRALNTAMQLQVPWVNKLAQGLKATDIEATRTVLTTLRRNLERHVSAEENS